MAFRTDRDEVALSRKSERRWHLPPPKRGGDLVVHSLLERVPAGTPLGLALRHRLSFPSGQALVELRSYDGLPGLDGPIVCVVDALIGLEKTRLELLDQIARSEVAPGDYHIAMQSAMLLERRLCLVLETLLTMDGLVSYMPLQERLEKQARVEVEAAPVPVEEPKLEPTCSLCDRPVCARALCRYHYNKARTKLKKPKSKRKKSKLKPKPSSEKKLPSKEKRGRPRKLPLVKSARALKYAAAKLLNAKKSEGSA